MKLNEETIAVLKNFSRMNQGIRVQPGNILTTRNASGTVFARAVLEDTFDGNICLFDLPVFLGMISLFKEPEIEIGTDELYITEGDNRVTFRYAHENMIVFPTDEQIAKAMEFPDVVVSFKLTKESFSHIIRAASVMKLPDIAIVGSGGKISVQSTNLKDRHSNNLSVVVGETDMEFSAVIKPDYLLNLIPEDYTISISCRTDSKGRNKIILRFESDHYMYWVAGEASSKF